MNYFTIIASDVPDQPGQKPGSNPMGSMWIFFLLMFVMMYFLIIRPQSKQRKEQAARVASIGKGDKIITIGGLHGTVHHISKTTVTVKLSEGVFVPFEKEAIKTVHKVGSGRKQEEVVEEDEQEEGAAGKIEE
ncbi:MAG: preprotein translocase subunit YajC [Roseibacillus sp.]